MKSLNHVNNDSENPHYLIFNNVDGYNEESNRDKYKTINGGKPIEYKKIWLNC